MYNLLKINKPKKEKTLREDIAPSEFYLPNVSFNAKELPEIKNWEVGKEYTMTIKVKMISYSEDRSIRSLETGKTNEEIRSRFDIIGVEPEKNVEKD